MPEALEPRRLLAAPPVGVGPESLVNQTLELSQSRPAAAADSAGHVIVAWQSQGQDGSGWGVYARRLDMAAGGAPGPEFRVNTQFTGEQLRPAVAASASGFVIVWDATDAVGSTDIYGQRYSADGVALGGEFPVNTNSEGRQVAPAVAMAPDGGFVVAWIDSVIDGQDRGIAARRFLADGTAAGPVFVVNTTTPLAQVNPAVAVGPDGRFAIAWDGSIAESEKQGIFARRFAADGTALGDDYLVADDATGLQHEPSMAFEGDGTLVFAWHTDGADGAGMGVRARRFGSDGSARGEPFAVNTFTAGDQSGASVSAAGDAGFVVAWQSDGQDGDGLGVYARRYGADGAPLSGELAVNTQATLDQSAPAAALTADGRFLVAWQSATADGSFDIYAQQFAPQGPPADPPAISVSSAAATEADAGATTNAIFTFTLSGPRDYPVSVHYATQDGTAVAPADYAATSGTLTFAPGETSKTVAVTIAGDALDEPDETFSLVLSDPIDGTLSTASAGGLILDNDPLPSMTIADASAFEQDIGESAPLVFDVTLSAPSSRVIRVAYQMGLNPADTAIRSVDYHGSDGILTFAPGETAKTIVVATIGDALYERNETFAVLLGFVETPVFVFPDDGAAVGTIVDDDIAPTVTIGDVTVVEGNEPAGQLIDLPVTLSAPSALPVTAAYHTVDDSAAAPSDYEPASGTLTFAPGETSKVIQVRVFGDTVEEAVIEDFKVVLTDVQNAESHDGTVTITDDDSQLPVVTAVFVSGTAWTSAFRQYVGNGNPISDRFGWPIGGGPAQLDTLPWSNLNQLSIRFNRDVNASIPDLAVSGLTVGQYPVTLIGYDRERFTYTFTFARTFTSDRLTLRLRSANAPNGVNDARTGQPLDGEWTAGQSYPSGNGTAGGNFVFALNVLPGDLTRDGAVNAADLADVRSRQFTSTTRPGSGAGTYSIFDDVNGSGSIDVIDYAAVRSRQQTTLPPPPPAPAISLASARSVTTRVSPLRRELFGSTSILA